ncbi:MAG: hypothetical protein EOM21_13645 [Gammaproteobacteria bacterium]|nr:hypothetical protein [Gammaproteobacteria bacterium]
MFRVPDDVGTLWVVPPYELTKDDVVSTNIPVVLPAWQTETLYPVGALVTRNGKSYQSLLTEAVSYVQDCVRIQNIDIDPAEDPPPYVPVGACEYSQAGQLWWLEIDPALTYVDALFDYNLFREAQVAGPMTLTIQPFAPYSVVAGFHLHGEDVTLTVDGESQTQSSALFQLEEGETPPYGGYLTHANKFLFMLEEETEEPFTLTISARDGRTALGNLVVGPRGEFGDVYTGSETGIVDYSRKERDVFGRAQVVERWYQEKLSFIVEAPARKLNAIKDVLVAYRNKPALYVGHDNPLRRELYTLGLINDIGIPIQAWNRSVLDITVESVGVPSWVSGIPAQVPPDPPPLPDEVAQGPWLAIAHDEAPYVTIVDSVTWERVEVNFELTGPAYAVLFSPDQRWLTIGHACPPFLTIVDTETWEAMIPPSVPGPVYSLKYNRTHTQLAVGHMCWPFCTVFDVSVWQPLNGDLGISDAVAEIAFAENDAWMVVATACNRYFRINPATWEPGTHLTSWSGRPIVFPGGNLHIMLAYSDRTTDRVDLIKLSDWVSKDATISLPGKPHILKIVPGDLYLAVGHRCPPYVSIFRMTDWVQMDTYFTLPSAPCSLDFTKDGLYLAVVYKTHPYCTLIRTANWTEFMLSFIEPEE